MHIMYSNIHFYPMQIKAEKIEGCSEHNNVLHCFINRQRAEYHKKLVVDFLDVTDAFGTIPIKHMTWL